MPWNYITGSPRIYIVSWCAVLKRGERYTQVVNNELYRQVQELIEAEKLAGSGDILNGFRQPVSRRTAKGDCLAGLQLLYISKEQAVFSYTENRSKFRSGDYLLLGEGTPFGEAVADGIPVVLTDYVPERRQVSVSGRWGKELPDIPPAGKYCLDLDPSDYTASTLSSAADDAFGGDFPWLEKLLNGTADLSALGETREAPELVRGLLDSLPLDHAQKEAVTGGLTLPLKLIQGPPGTGKTYLLAQTILLLQLMGQRVLVTAFTHRAIDNVLTAVARAGVVNVFKAGREQTFGNNSSGDPAIKRFRMGDARGPFVLGATVFEAYKLLGRVPFDVVAIDEAGQMPVQHGIASLLHAPRAVLAGDHMQLRPLVQSRCAHPIAQRSIFELLHDHYGSNSTMLEVSYRLNEGLIEFPGKAFYEGRIRPSEAAAHRCLDYKSGGELDSFIVRSEPVSFLHVDHSRDRQDSALESVLIARLVKELVIIHGVNPAEIGVVAPHRAQVRMITDRIRASYDEAKLGRTLSAGELNLLTIETVERMQGQERDVIILSLNSSDPRFVAGSIRFLHAPGRLNVAITRPRKRLFVVGSKHFWGTPGADELEKKYMTVSKKYLRYLEGRMLEATEIATKLESERSGRDA